MKLQSLWNESSHWYSISMSPKVLPALDVDGGPRPFPPLVNHSLVTNSFPKVLACLLWWRRWWWWWWWWLILKQSLGNLNWGCENVNKWIISSMWSVSNNHIIIKDIVVFWWWIMWWSLWHCLIFHFLKAL